MKEKELFAKLLFITNIIVMIVLAIFRFCGIGYFANTYAEHEYILWVQELILFALKWLELFLVIATLTRTNRIAVLIISFVYANIYWFVINSIIVFVLDLLSVTILPFVLNKFSYKTITYGLILFAIMASYQAIMMIARYSIDINEKFNYIAGIASVFDYKIFVLSIYLLSIVWRTKMDKINTPNPEDVKNYGGGHCLFFWGKFDKVCEVIGKALVGICTLGIAPLCVHLYRKSKNEKVK